jgi:hypothetical protein
MESPSYQRSHTQCRGGKPSRWKPGSKSLRRPQWLGGQIHTGRQASHQAAAEANRGSLEIHNPAEVDAGSIENAEPFVTWRRPTSPAKNWVHAVGEVSGVTGGGMMVQSGQRKLGTSRGQPRRTRTAKAPRISRKTMKSRCARERDAWGRLSVDGPGQYNPDRSEGPWGRATSCCSNGGAPPVRPSGTERNAVYHLRSIGPGEHEGRIQTERGDGHAGCRLNRSLEREGTA